MDGDISKFRIRRQSWKSQRFSRFLSNRASETEEQRKEKLRIRCKKDRARRRTKKATIGKEKYFRNRRPRETAPGHFQNIEAR